MSLSESGRRQEVQRRIRWNKARRELPGYRVRLSRALGVDIPIEDFLGIQESEELREVFEKRKERNDVYRHGWREDQQEVVWAVVHGMTRYYPDTPHLLLADEVAAARVPAHLMIQ